MDRSLKERVIGASVLVGLAVWLIPWVLDGPVPDAGPAGAAQAPAAERSAPLRTRTIRLEEQRNSAAQAGAPDIPDIPVPRDSEGVPAVAPDGSANGRQGAAEVPARVSAAADAQVDPPDSSPGSGAAVAAGAPRSNSGELDTAASGGTPSAGSPVAEGPGWLVQVGSFSDEENARRQADRLAAAGFPARLYPHSSGGGTMYRVRVGPEPSREGAEGIASSLRDVGFVAQVVSGD